MRIQKSPWWGMWALVPASALMFLDQTILPVALPAIQKEFGAADVAMQWSVNSYLLAIALFVLLGGKLVDGWGGKRVFLAGTSLFLVSSLGCGWSGSSSWLIGMRFLQGVAGALLVPSSSALMLGLFPKEQRGRAVGFQVSVSSIFLILGPLLGGWLTEQLSWRWVFWINLPAGLLSIAATLLLFPAAERRRLTVDGWGSFWFSLATLGVVIGLMQGPSWGWRSMPTLVSFGIGAVALLGLFLRERRANHPYLELSLLHVPLYRAAAISIAASSAILMLGVFWAIFFQQTLGYSPLEAGLLTFVSALPVIYMAPIAGSAADRFGSRSLISAGFACLMGGLGVIALWGPSSVVMLVLGLFIFGSGVPLIMTPSYSTGLSALPSAKMGVGAGMLGTLRTLASTLALAIMGAALSQLAMHRFLPQVLTENSSALSESKARALVLGEPSAQGDVSEWVRHLLQQAEIYALEMLHLGLIIALAAAWWWVMRVFKEHHIPPHEHGLGDGWDHL